MNSKSWWASKTVWAAILGMLGSLLLAFGWDSQYQAWIALEAPVMTILTIIFRWTATATLTK